MNNQSATAPTGKISAAPAPEEIAIITINPWNEIVRPALAGLAQVGLSAQYLIVISPAERLKQEFKRNKLLVFQRVLIPKLGSAFSSGGNKNEEMSPAQHQDSHVVMPGKMKVSKLNNAKTAELIKSLKIKYLINGGAGIFRREITEIPNLFIVNAHAGRLPKYRNMNVVEWQIFNDEPVIGTVHRIDRGIDTGAIWLQEEISMAGVLDVESARHKAFREVSGMIGKAILAHSRGEIVERPQTRAEGVNWYRMHSYFRRLTDEKLKAKSVG